VFNCSLDLFNKKEDYKKNKLEGKLTFKSNFAKKKKHENYANPVNIIKTESLRDYYLNSVKNISFGRSMDEHRSFGATVQEDGSVKFKIWASNSNEDKMFVEVVNSQSEFLKDYEGDSPKDSILIKLKHIGNGFFETDPEQKNNFVAKKGSIYRFVFTDKQGNEHKCKDICSKSQPYDSGGWSQVVEEKFDWKDNDWDDQVWFEGKDPRRLRNNTQTDEQKNSAVAKMITQEIHIGTFTKEGNFQAALKKLREIKKDGIYNTVEIMPIGEFYKDKNWGYDGVDIFAVESSYGGVNNFKKFVKEAHKLGINVILDVVYNHTSVYETAMDHFTDYKHPERNEFGTCFNTEKGQVRNFIVDNALYWLNACHVDGFRLDASHCIPDSKRVLKELSIEIKEHNPNAILIAEFEGDASGILEPLEKSNENHTQRINKLNFDNTRNNIGIDAVWNLGMPYFIFRDLILHKILKKDGYLKPGDNDQDLHIINHLFKTNSGQNINFIGKRQIVYTC
jgi:1,4-alpha-glucan branching enzyme